eukprot:GHVH01004608.1.p1 GENE.GHVH01004608.1~~GHVH01004608.1.p1  ORF type:complete len:522 (-),score=70.07 GHVH01004608.1:50-1615(-)
MSSVLGPFAQRCAHELKIKDDSTTKINLPSYAPEGYVNQIHNRDLLAFISMWDLLSKAKVSATNASNCILNTPLNLNQLLIELNGPTLSRSDYEEYRSRSTKKYDEWSSHRVEYLDVHAAADSFDFSSWPTCWPEIRDVLQITDDNESEGRFTHFEDIPTTTPLIRIFVLRLLQLSSRYSFATRNCQKYNLWPRLRRRIVSDPVDYSVHKKLFPEEDLALSDYPWVRLAPNHRILILNELIRYAVKSSSALHNAFAESLENTEYGHMFLDTKFDLSKFNSLVPMTETGNFLYWFFYANNITEYYIIEQDKRCENAIRVIAWFDDDGPDILSSFDTLCDADDEYPPNIERLNELVELEKKSIIRRSRKRAFEATGETNDVTYSKSGRPQRQAAARSYQALEAVVQDRPSRGDRARLRSDRSKQEAAAERARREEEENVEEEEEAASLGEQFLPPDAVQRVVDRDVQLVAGDDSTSNEGATEGEDSSDFVPQSQTKIVTRERSSRPRRANVAVFQESSESSES